MRSITGITDINPNGSSIVDSKIPSREIISDAIGDQEAVHSKLKDFHEFPRKKVSYKPESKPVTPLAFNFRQGSAKLDCVALWFF